MVAAALALALPPAAAATTPPSIDAESVSDVTAHDATLRAEINPNGAYTGYEFQVDTSGRYDFTHPVCPFDLPGSASCGAIIVGGPLPPGLPREPPPGYVPAGLGDRAVSLDLASIGAYLAPTTTYHYRVIASNGGPLVDGPDQTFTTSAAPKGRPLVEGLSASNVTSTDATLEARIDADGLETTYRFTLVSGCPVERVTCDAIVSYPLPSGELPAAFGSRAVSLDLAEAGLTLRPGTRYRYGIEASNAAGTAIYLPAAGLPVFTTPPLPVSPLPPPRTPPLPSPVPGPPPTLAAAPIATRDLPVATPGVPAASRLASTGASDAARRGQRRAARRHRAACRPTRRHRRGLTGARRCRRQGRG